MDLIYQLFKFILYQTASLRTSIERIIYLILDSEGYSLQLIYVHIHKEYIIQCGIESMLRS